MSSYDPGDYGERWAAVYDEFVVPRAAATEAAVELLATLAGSGPVLELGVGTGRLALPLAARGLDVHGIDASDAMLARLREKPGADRIHVVRGDFGDVSVDGRFSLVFVVFNTFFALLTQDDQVRCVGNVAARLAEGGVFVV